ncbi:hypothetical protein A2U01_0071654, partial [Trifolium medium]|nr:hypothetical protein [Trifolium medium]
MDIVEKPRKDKAGTHLTKETHDVENAAEEEPDEGVELTTEKEPTVHDSPQLVPTPPPVYTTEKPQAMVTHYPL